MPIIRILCEKAKVSEYSPWKLLFLFLLVGVPMPSADSAK